MTITGSGFGSTQGTSTVTFGERVNALGFAPVARTAAVSSWSNTSITCTVPSMSPGKAGCPGTYHPIYVTVGGAMSNSSDFYITPAYTVTGRTFNNLTGANGNAIDDICAAAGVPAHDVLFDGCTFSSTQMDGRYASGGDSATGLIWMDSGQTGNAYNLTFYNATLVSNNSQYGDGVNGVKWNAWNNNYNDLTFDTCHFGQFSRMGIEMCQNDNYGVTVFQRTRISNCDFLPVGGEPISFSTWASDNLYPSPLNALVDSCLVYGNSTGGPGWGYSGAIETNGSSYIECRNTTFWCGGGLIFNLGHQLVGQNSGLLFDHCTVDFTKRHALQNDDGARLIGFTSDPGFGLRGAMWRNCDFNMGDASNAALNATWADGAVGHLYNCDLSTSYMHGYAWGVPASSVNDYWGDWNLSTPYATYVTNQHNQLPRFGTRP